MINFKGQQCTQNRNNTTKWRVHGWGVYTYFLLGQSEKHGFCQMEDKLGKHT